MADSNQLSLSAGKVSAADIARALSALVPPSHRALLFGSRATGRATPRSDWDIGIVGPSALDGALLERMRDALDRLPTLRHFDVVDLCSVTPTLRDRALHEGVALT
jgi:predicted nucleotidyltransferase